MCGLYILDNAGEPAPAADALEWGRWFQGADRVVALDGCRGARVSTVFLGVDHNHAGEGPPVLFETMVFDAPGWEDYQERYATRAQALAGHARVLGRLRRAGPPD